MVGECRRNGNGAEGGRYIYIRLQEAAVMLSRFWTAAFLRTWVAAGREASPQHLQLLLMRDILSIVMLLSGDAPVADTTY